MAEPLSVIFDLDGTLVESAPDLTQATNQILARHERRPVTVDEVRHMVGRGARVMIESAMRLTGDPISRVELDYMLPDFLTYYRAHIADHSHTFPGVTEVLDQLKGQGCKLAVCTNKFEDMSRDLLDALAISRYFDDIVGSDTLEHRKPHPGHILGTLERIGGTPQNAVMVGDSPNDINAAKAAGVKSIAVTFGYTDVPARDLGADAVIERYRDLVPELEIVSGRMLY